MTSEDSVHVLDSVEAEASGPSYSVPRRCGALARRGTRARLFTIGVQPSLRACEHQAYPQDFSGLPLLRSMRFSRRLNRALLDAARDTSVIHTHGLWLMANVYPAGAAVRTGKPLVFSPRGMLGEAALRFSAAKKRAFWAVLQARATAAATCIHVTSDQEYHDVRAFGLRQPIAVVPNGIDVPQASPAEDKRRRRERTVLFLGRLHPKKGLGSLLEAWAEVAYHYPDWHLKIVGPIDSDYAAYLAKQLMVLPRARLAGPLYGIEKAAAYRDADLFLLPTLNENFGMTVAEALAQGTPVISTKGAPWAGLEAHDCGWWIDHGARPLAKALGAAMATSPERLVAMGEAGRAWMRRDFDWDTVAASMAAVYRWLNGAGSRPSFVAD